MKINKDKFITQIEVYQTRCPYCRETKEHYCLEEAESWFEFNVESCQFNPNKRKCGSCEFYSGKKWKCKRDSHSTFWNNTCSYWKCVKSLMKYIDK